MPQRLIAEIMDGRDTSALNSEADHRIANNLSLIAGLVRLTASNLPQGAVERRDAQTLLEHVAARIEGVARLHRLLSSSQDDAIDLRQYLQEIVEITSGALSLEHCSVVLEAAEFTPVSAQQAAAIGLLVQEAVANSLKHAHPSGVAGKIVLRCEATSRDGSSTVHIVDDGVGLPDGFDPAASNSLGLRLMRALASQLGARLEFRDTGLGLDVRLDLPGRAF